MGQMAATAGGVAIGSTVGHVVGHALTGGGGSNQQQQQYPNQYGAPPQQYGGPPQQYAPPPQQYGGYPQAEQSPCSWELKQYADCAQAQSDVGLCEGYLEVLKECKQRFNNMGSSA